MYFGLSKKFLDILFQALSIFDVVAWLTKCDDIAKKVTAATELAEKFHGFRNVSLSFLKLLLDACDDGIIESEKDFESQKNNDMY